MQCLSGVLSFAIKSMRKVFIYSSLGVILLIGAWLIYTYIIPGRKSPAGTVKYGKRDFSINIRYFRPYKKGRLIFGEESRQALVPYGKYWRTGANAATEIRFSKDVLFLNDKVKQGRYRMYTIPGETEWVVALNSELGKSGHEEPDYSKDILRVKVPSMQSRDFYEQFTISVADSADSMWVQLNWDKTEIRIPVRIL